MTRQQLFENIKAKRSFLCIGLDTDLKKIPAHLLQSEDAVFEFNKQIIDATHDVCVAYKLNLAFYESLGSMGLESFEKTLRYIPKNIFTIADAKRGDIGNTSTMYAETFFKYYDADAVTVTPYMGEDSVKPFLNYAGKFTIVLALTSNDGAKDFQFMSDGEEMLFEKVIRKTMSWGNPDNLMFVVGATKDEYLKRVRELAPENFLLIPGVGAQGGDLEKVAQHGMNQQCGLLVNSSRQIIYAGSGNDFAEKARAEAVKVQQQMEKLLQKYL
ncbi:MAG TPA: orotidine-5'-phosphate decarboxylase [Bacteroidia bacterium]|nr:orotidine-5'-phosphate decarboxylase [Bacteroidia bacterium]